MIVESWQHFGGGQGGGACLVVEHLESYGKEVVAFSYGHFILPVEGACAICIGKAVPLIVKDGLYSIISRKDACQGRVPQKGGFEELREMDVLCFRGLETQKGGREDKHFYKGQIVFQVLQLF
jgi:hypothetical protein